MWIDGKQSKCQYATNSAISRSSKTKGCLEIDTHKVFVELCYQQMLKGHKQGTFFDKQCWNQICMDIREKTGNDYDERHIKNHWDNVKGDWTIRYKLKKKQDLDGIMLEIQLAPMIDEW